MPTIKFHSAIILFLMACVPILQNSVVDNSKLEYIDIAIAAICSTMIFARPNESYSLHKVVNLFFLFFLCIAPCVQYKGNIQMMGTFFYTDEYITTSLYVLFILIGYNFFYWIFRQSCTVPGIVNKQNMRKLRSREEVKLLVLAGAICFLFLAFNNFNLISLFVRDGDVTTRQDQSQIEFLVMEYFVRPMPMIMLLVALRRKVTHKIVLYLLFVFFFFSCPVTGMARFSVAALYIPVCLCAIPWLRRRNNFAYVFIFGLLIVFPMLNLFRNYSGGDSFEQIGFFDQFSDMNFDAYSMFMRVLRDDIVTHGRQLLGVLLFFLPRSFWPDKPIGSGAYVAEVQNLSFSNLSMPFWGEGYINFGIYGIVLFMLILSFFTAKCDKIYWTRIVYSNDYKQYQYMMLIGLLFFMMRGDLMSSYAYLCGFMAAYYVVTRVVIRKSY